MSPDFWSHQRLKRISAALLISLAIALLFTALSDSKGASLIKRGDFPGFYVLAVIHKLGLSDRLYDAELQRDIQNAYWPSFEGGFYMSAYPAYVANLLYPLAFFAPQTAQLVFTLFMFACLIGTCLLLKRFNPSLPQAAMPFFVISCFFCPLIVSLVGAQNTPLSMLLLCAIAISLQRSTAVGDTLAGVFCGIWLFKPQYALFVLIFFLVCRLWYAIAAATLIGMCFYLIAAGTMGLLWPLGWLKTLAEFSEQNFLVNSAQIVSISGTVKAASLAIGLSAQTQAILNILASAAVVLLLCWSLIKVWAAPRDLLGRFFLAFMPVMVLCSPQTLFYDLGIAYAALLGLGNFKRTEELNALLALICISWPLVLWREYTEVPLFCLVAAFILYRTREFRPNLLTGAPSQSNPPLP